MFFNFVHQFVVVDFQEKVLSKVYSLFFWWRENHILGQTYAFNFKLNSFLLIIIVIIIITTINIMFLQV